MLEYGSTWWMLIVMTSTCGCYQLEREEKRCEPITVSFCLDMKYNLTMMPNLVGDANQREADLRINEFKPLVQVRCSGLLKFFLCSLYAPMCTEQVDETMIIPACRDMCLQVKASCEPVMASFNFKWPAVLDCDNLPDRGDKSNLCIHPPDKDGDSYSSLASNNILPHVYDENLNIMRILENLKGQQAPPTSGHSLSDRVSPPLLRLHFPLKSGCPDRFVRSDHANTLSSNLSCLARCNYDVLFKSDDKKFAEIWMIVWSSLCFISTLLTSLTFFIDSPRFEYPERPIIFFSMSSFITASAFLLRLIVGAEAVSCHVGNGAGGGGGGGAEASHLIYQSLDNSWCVVVFLLTYFFGIASCIWWVVLTLTFYLAAGRKWGGEAIGAVSGYFHAAAWGTSALLTVSAIVVRRVDGDELTGMCFITNRDRFSLVVFVIAPLAFLLIVGSCFIVAGFVAMCRIRSDLKLDRTNIRKLEKLMAKIGIFSLVYTLPATCVIAAFFYERVNAETWRQIAWQTPCKPVMGAPQLVDCSLDRSIPAVEVFMLKMFMLMIVGTASGLWVWSSKTVASWGNFFKKIRFCGRPKTTKNEHELKSLHQNNIKVNETT